MRSEVEGLRVTDLPDGHPGLGQDGHALLVLEPARLRVHVLEDHLLEPHPRNNLGTGIAGEHGRVQGAALQEVLAYQDRQLLRVQAVAVDQRFCPLAPVVAARAAAFLAGLCACWGAVVAAGVDCVVLAD
jgi:hypothetical protein